MDPCWVAATLIALAGLDGGGGGVGTVGSVGGGTLVGVVVVPVVVVPVVVVPVVAVPVVVEPGACTVIVPVINACASQKNVYVPGVLNVHVPLHPAGAGWFGSGGTDPEFAPAVWVQLVGSAPLKSALCALPPLGYENVTVPPWAIVADSEPPFDCHSKSTAVKLAVLGGDVPVAMLGSSATAAPSSPASGRASVRGLNASPAPGATISAVPPGHSTRSQMR